MPRVAVITGAGSGIGLATTQLLASKGWCVVAGVRQQAHFDHLLKVNGNVQPVLLDVTKDAEVQSAVEVVRKLVGQQGIDALINNAAETVIGPVEETPVQVFGHMMDVNYLGYIRVIQGFLPLLRQSLNTKTIVNIGSEFGSISYACGAAYCSTKYALEALTDSLRQELWGQGIRVVLIKPGPARTAALNSYRGRSASFLPAYGTSRYDKLLDEMENVLKFDERYSSLKAEDVAPVIVKAIESRAPCTRYRVGAMMSNLRVLLKALLPDWLLDHAIRMYVTLVQVFVSDAQNGKAWR